MGGLGHRDVGSLGMLGCCCLGFVDGGGSGCTSHLCVSLHGSVKLELDFLHFYVGLLT